MAAQFLYFANSTSDTLTIPVQGIVAIDSTDADTMQIYYKDITDVAGGSVIFEITSGYAADIIKLLGKAIATSRSAVIVVADDVNSDYLSGTGVGGVAVAVTACTTIALT